MSCALFASSSDAEEDFLLLRFTDRSNCRRAAALDKSLIRPSLLFGTALWIGLFDMFDFSMWNIKAVTRLRFVIVL